jgi:hypothetical protein
MRFQFKCTVTSTVHWDGGSIHENCIASSSNESNPSSFPPGTSPSLPAFISPTVRSFSPVTCSFILSFFLLFSTVGRRGQDFFSFFWYYEGKRGEDLEAKVFDRMPQREVGLFKKKKKKMKRVHEGP